MKKKNVFLLIFLIAAAVVLGGLVSSLTKDVSWLNWLTYGQTIGIDTANPFVLNLVIVKLSFGFEFTVNVLQILLVGGALLIYRRIR